MKRCLVLLTLFLFSQIAMSQATNATLSGGVADTSGRLIIGADVAIQNDATGIIYSSKTNNSGMYIVPTLPPGHYHVQVSKAGFKTVIKADVTLSVQGAVALNFELPIGAASESVTVEAGSSLLNTTDASVSTVVDRKFVANIPLNGRSFQDLISMTPGVQTQGPQSSTLRGASGDFSVNGQRTESNVYSVDGLSANSGAGYPTGASQAAVGGAVPSSTVLGTTQTLLSVDALEEFRVLSSTYSAEFGRSPGGQFALATRSGTKSFHGGIFDYFRNDFFDANDWFNDHSGLRITALRQNDFGGTLGGPLPLGERNRNWFFFLSYEGLRLTQPQPGTTLYVPDQYMRQQAATTVQGILNAYPLPTTGPGNSDYGTPESPSLATFLKAYSLPSKIDSTSFRLDHAFNSRWSGFLRAAYTPSSTQTRSLSAFTNRGNQSQNYAAGVTTALFGSLNNIFRLGFSASRSFATTSLDDFGGATPLSLPLAMGLPSTENTQATFQLIIPGAGVSVLTSGTPVNKERQWNLVDLVNGVEGRNSWKFGIDYLRVVSTILPPATQASAGFYSAQAALAGSATSLGIDKLAQATPIFNDTAVFFQDEWRIRENLSLSLGLRWEIAPAPSEAHGQAAYTVLGDVNVPSTLSLAPRGTALFRTGWFNLAPRLGVAWQLRRRSGWETVVRTGGGVFFDTANEVAALGFSGLGFVAYKIYPSAPLPISPEQLALTISVAPPYTSSSVYAFPQHLQLPYTLEWNTSLEQSLGRSQTLSVTYVGSNGRRLLNEQLHNVSAINPVFGAVYYFPNGVTSNYQALQTKFQRSVASGLQALVSYTWAHSIDFGSNSASLPLTRGDSDFDIRHNLQAGLSWDLPRIRRAQWGSSIANDWSLDARIMDRTAFPVTLNGAYITDPASGLSYYGNVNLIPGKPLYLHGPQYPGGRAINGGPKALDPAITLPAAPNLGNAPRNLLRGFGANQINAALRKSWAFRGGVNLQFRAEAFNLLNHPNFGYVDPYTTDATFGTATKMLNQSLGNTASQYQQGGPRSMQFALKASF